MCELEPLSGSYVYITIFPVGVSLFNRRMRTEHYNADREAEHDQTDDYRHEGRGVPACMCSLLTGLLLIVSCRS